MMEKNNLDNLFKEKFKDFSETPGERVWENIEASLNKRKKKGIVPIWWQLGGAAAALALLFYLINPFSTNENTVDSKVVDTEQNAPSNTKKDSNDNHVDSKILEESQNNQVAGTSPSESTQRSNGDAKSGLEVTESQVSGVHTSKQNKVVHQDDGLAANANNQKKGQRTQTLITETIKTDGIPINGESGIAENNERQKDKTEKGASLSTEGISEAKNEVAITENEDKEDDTISIFDVIEGIKDQEEKATANTSGKRWSMGPSVAPVFFGSVGEGSPIHSNFASNSKSGNLNLSYGLTVTYNVSEKLSVRSGIHRVDYGYDTNDVVFTSSLTTSTNQLIDNINYAQTSRNLVVESKSNEVQAFSNNASISGTTQPFEGRMVQQLGYIEVPMELNYALLDKKFGINIIGGVSSLFLVDNAVSLESEQLITEMGEANNANDINFSTNFGVGFNYEISQKLQLNVEPIFKYQLNTFSETAGNFRPYSVGVYSGLSFRF
ncbi:MAG: hypothetical protein AAF039_10030 [Bacteroidota bacterium]